VNNLSNAVRQTHTFAVVSLLEESPRCLSTIPKQRPEYGLKKIAIEAHKVFVQQTSINGMFITVLIYTV